MFNIFKSKATMQREKDFAEAHPADAYAGLLMYATRNPQASNNPKFVKEFVKMQNAWFAYYTTNFGTAEKLDLNLQEHKLVCSCIAVIIAAINEDHYSVEDMDTMGLVNIIKQEANLRNIPRVYADAYVKYFETETV